MDITGHPLESLRGDPKLQESVEKKTFTGESTFTPIFPRLYQNHPNLSWNMAISGLKRPF